MSRFKELFSGAFFLGLAAVIYAASYSIRLTRADPLGPQFFPRLVAIAMAVLALVSLAKGFLGLRPAAKESSEKRATKDAKVSFFATIALLVSYMLLIETVGFILLSVIYLFIQIVLVTPKEDLTKSRYILFAAISLAVPVALYFVFYHAFNIFLPPGILG